MIFKESLERIFGKRPFIKEEPINGMKEGTESKVEDSIEEKATDEVSENEVKEGTNP